MKQRNIPWLGAITDSLYVTLPVLSIMNFFSILAVLYTNVYPRIQEYLPWMRFWIFLVIVGVLVIVLMLLVYKFIVPSLWTFRSKQMFKHESQVVDKLDKIDQRLDRLEKKQQ